MIERLRQSATPLAREFRVEVPINNRQYYRGRHHDGQRDRENAQMTPFGQPAYQVGQTRRRSTGINHHLQSGIEVGLREVHLLKPLAGDEQVGDSDVSLTLAHHLD